MRSSRLTSADLHVCVGRWRGRWSSRGGPVADDVLVGQAKPGWAAVVTGRWGLSDRRAYSRWAGRVAASRRALALLVECWRRGESGRCVGGADEVVGGLSAAFALSGWE